MPRAMEAFLAAASPRSSAPAPPRAAGRGCRSRG
jgi:hypothetical protein